jgi:hypothetical protein
MVQKAIRFDDDDYLAVEAAAKAEGLDISSYCRRCTLVYTREHHPEAFPDKKPAPTE